MAKSKSPWLKDYQKARKNLLQNLNRMKKRGYDVSKIKVPDIPKRIGEAQVKSLVKLNEQRYKKATRTREKVNPKTGEIEVVKEKGLRAKYKEQVESRRKATEKRKRNKEEREIKRRQERERQQIEEQRKLDEWRERVENAPDIEGEDEYQFRPDLRDKYDPYIDPKTGEVIDNKGGKRPPNDDFMPYEDFYDKLWDEVSNDLDHFSEYEGNKRHGKNTNHDADTRDNADKIRRELEEARRRNPDAFNRALEQATYNDWFKRPEFRYFHGGGSAFMHYFNQLMGIFEDGKSIYDSDYDDYDEQNEV